MSHLVKSDNLCIDIRAEMRETVMISMVMMMTMMIVMMTMTTTMTMMMMVMIMMMMKGWALSGAWRQLGRSWMNGSQSLNTTIPLIIIILIIVIIIITLFFTILYDRHLFAFLSNCSPRTHQMLTFHFNLLPHCKIIITFNHLLARIAPFTCPMYLSFWLTPATSSSSPSPASLSP